MADPAWFGGRLRELREAAGLTQQELADRSGLTREGVAQLETGRRKPAWASVLMVSDALGISTEEFRRPPTSEKPGLGRPRAKQEGGQEARSAVGPGRATAAGKKAPGGRKKG
jgi:transcriptional regulator with XRE-family HTH domain